MTVNGATVTTLGTRALPTDRIIVDGKALRPRAPHVWVAVNKPAGVVTTARDPEGRQAVTDLVPRALGRLFPVGRLDVQSTGLVLLTNDGETAARLLHPRYHVPRRYRVKVGGAPDEGVLRRMRRGVRLDDGRTAPARVHVEKKLPTKTWLDMTVFEGRSHLIRRLCDAVGHRVDKLERVAIGPVELGRLRRGETRLLEPKEVTALRRAHRAPSASPRTSPRATPARGAKRSAVRHRRS